MNPVRWAFHLFCVGCLHSLMKFANLFGQCRRLLHAEGGFRPVLVALVGERPAATWFALSPRPQGVFNALLLGPGLEAVRGPVGESNAPLAVRV
jgi:hypothetical protein